MLDFLFPKTDINSGDIWENISQLTKNKLKIHDEICYICKKESSWFDTHSHCKKKYSPEKIVTCFYYNNHIKSIILNFKYYHNYKVWEDLSKLMLHFFKMYLPIDNNVAITYVPMHWIRKYFIKWYNQSEILAKKLSKYTKLPLIKICDKWGNTKAQAKINNRNERLKNLKNSFTYNKNLKLSSISKIIIVDDIITTWSTIEEMTKCIKKQHPFLKIYWITLARK